MKVEHIAERLEQLAAYRTPGRPTPDFPIPLNEAALLREAARRLRILHADAAAQTYTNSQAAQHKMWALVDDATKLIVAHCNGKKRDAQLMVQDFIDNQTPHARSFVVRAIYLGED